MERRIPKQSYQALSTRSEGEKSITVHSKCHVKHTLAGHSVDVAPLTLKSLPVLTHGFIVASGMCTLDKVGNLPDSPGLSLVAETPHVSEQKRGGNQGPFDISLKLTEQLVRFNK